MEERYNNGLAFYERRIHAHTMDPETGERNYAIDGTPGIIKSANARDRILMAYPDQEVSE